LRGPGHQDLLDPDDYGRPQRFAKEPRAAAVNGIVYPSVRHPGGQRIAAFFPDGVSPPAQVDHFCYYWDGKVVSYVRKVSGDRAIYQIRPTERQMPPDRA